MVPLVLVLSLINRPIMTEPRHERAGSNFFLLPYKGTCSPFEASLHMAWRIVTPQNSVIPKTDAMTPVQITPANHYRKAIG